jgi:hypothetical protein
MHTQKVPIGTSHRVHQQQISHADEGIWLVACSVTSNIPLPPRLSDAVPCTKMLPHGNDALFAGLVIATEGITVSEEEWVTPDRSAERGPILPVLPTADTL